MRIIEKECLGGGGRMYVSSAEAVQGWVRCSACGKVLKIRANRENAASIPRHKRSDN